MSLLLEFPERSEQRQTDPVPGKAARLEGDETMIFYNGEFDPGSG